MAQPQTPFYKAWIQIGGVFYPVYPSSISLLCPYNYVMPPIIGNYWQWNYYEGLRTPMFEAQMVLRDESAGVLGTTFMNYFMSRTTDVSNDTVAVSGGISVWNGRRGFSMVDGVKAESFSIGATSGNALQFTVRFIGTDYAPFSSGQTTAAPTLFTGWSNANLLSWANMAFPSGVLSNDCWNFNASYSNNSSPNMGMTNSVFVAGQNAGSPTAGFSLLTQAASMPSSLPTANNGTFPAPTTPTPLAFAVSGNSAARTFTFSNPIINNPDDIRIAAPRVMQEYQFLCPGGDGMTVPPLVLS